MRNEISIAILLATLLSRCGCTELARETEHSEAFRRNSPLQLISDLPVTVFRDSTGLEDEYIRLPEIQSVGCGGYQAAFESLIRDAKRFGADGVMNIESSEGAACVDGGGGPDVFIRGKMIKYVKNIRIWSDSNHVYT